MTTPTRIVGVAIRIGNMFVAMPAPARHHHLLHEMYRLRIEAIENRGADKQGFYTSDGRFVTREEALPIATAAGQIVEKHDPKTKLFSEDMW